MNSARSLLILGAVCLALAAGSFVAHLVSARAHQKVLETGKRATATIVKKTARSGRSNQYFVDLRMSGTDGRSVTFKNMVSRERYRQLRRGALVPIRLDPHDADYAWLEQGAIKRTVGFLRLAAWFLAILGVIFCGLGAYLRHIVRPPVDSGA